MTKSKYDARHQLKQLGWSDEELDAIGLSLQDEGKVTIPERPWTYTLVDTVSDMPNLLVEPQSWRKQLASYILDRFRGYHSGGKIK